jgi:cytochrome c biogenesis factor
MKEASKMFATIAAILLGSYWAWDGFKPGYYNTGSEPVEIIFGLLLVASGLTAIWFRYAKINSN